MAAVFTISYSGAFSSVPRRVTVANECSPNLGTPPPGYSRVFGAISSEYPGTRLEDEYTGARDLVRACFDP